MKRFLKVLSLLILTATFVYAADDVVNYRGKGANRDTDIFNLDSDGNIWDEGGSGTIGKSGYPYATGYFTDLNAADDLTVTDDSTLNGVTVFPPDTYTLGSGTETTPTSTYGLISSTGGALTLTATPTISTGTALVSDGQQFVIRGATENVTFQDNGTLSGSRLQLKAGTRVLHNGDVLGLIYDATNTVWIEEFFIDIGANTSEPMGVFTEAQLKVSTPTAVGLTYYDSTNKAVVVATGTSTCYDYGQVNAGGTAPAGW